MDFSRDALQAGVENKHGEGSDPGEAHEDEGAESGVGICQPCRPISPQPNVAKESVDYSADLVEVRPCEDADYARQAESKGESHPEPVLRPFAVQAVDQERYEQARRHTDRDPEQGPPEQMEERVQEDGVM